MTIAEPYAEQDHVKKYAKNMLRNSLFTGTFQEKRFIEPLNSYRDVIRIGSNEDDFVTNLLAVKRRVQDAFPKCPWIGVTEPRTAGAPAGYNLWVELKEEVTGRYWYKVRTVEFLGDEVRLKLEVVRPVGKTISSDVVEEEEEQIFDLEAIKKASKENLRYFVKEVLTFENCKSAVIFTVCLLSSITVGAVNFARYLLEYTLKFMREVSFFVKAITPVINSFLNACQKIIFGLYHLIFSLFRSTKPPVYNAYLNIDPKQLPIRDPRERYNQYFPKELEYYSANSSRDRFRL